jgi:hypothetical protein
MGRPKKVTTEQQPKPKKNTVKVKKLTTDETSDYRKLTDYIQEVYLKQGVLDPPWALLMTQVKDIVNKYGLSYVEILHVLQYMVQIEGIDFSDKDSLGLIPYYIDRTDRYIVRYKEVKQAVKNFNYDEKVVEICPQQPNVRYKKKNENFD